MDERIAQFNKYLVTYGPGDEQTGIRGIRSDAPKDAIDAFIEWYRDEHRYENGRKYNKTSKKIRDLVVEVGESGPGSDLVNIPSDRCCRLALCESH